MLDRSRFNNQQSQERSKNRSLLWFPLALLAIGIAAFGLRFWGLSRFNMLVFDEVYFAKFADNYLTQTPFFDGHPPLSKYLIALGMWLGQYFPFAQEPQNELTGSLRSTFSYRWMNALVGSLIPLVMAGVAYEVGRRRSFALLAGAFTALDGLLLVESRYAFTNVYLLLFGLAGQWMVLRALRTPSTPRKGTRQWVLAGFFFGAAACVKWNGLWFLLGIYAVWGWAKIDRFLTRQQSASSPSGNPEAPRGGVLQQVAQIPVWKIALYLGFLPLLVYSLIWIPHLQLDTSFNFWETQQQILAYHQRVGGNEPSVHPYCSPWYTWPWLIRPVLYVYETARNLTDAIPIEPDIPTAQAKVIYDVHAIGNPLLWWFSTATILTLILVFSQHTIGQLQRPRRQNSESALLPSQELWVIGYLVINYGANLLPWVPVQRCTFLYHYLGAYLFALLGLAWLVDRWWHSQQSGQRILALSIGLGGLLAFLFWLPLYLGLPLSLDALQLRRWLVTW
ncbi:MAG: phospholipid carrier-dependent glycosyltransferase [Leptolyngbyaceae cyanobacterium bins.59]|nr:phospholipid carrier-dependent glycosyltransferase [Leptolyngbyaceae cyanobacterium bins.59]